MKIKNKYESELFKLKSDFNLNLSFNLSSVLTKREIEVLRYVVSGLNNEEIGKELYISNNTIKIHIKNIMYKLREAPDINIKIKNRIQLAVIAIKYGIVEI